MRSLLLIFGAALLAAPPAPAQLPTPSPAASDDREVDPVEPDFVVVNMPTQARMPRGGWAFRVTHRFSRPLGDGSLGDLAKDFFGFDSGGLIGLELRYGIARATQVGIHRTSDRTVQLFGQRDVRRAEGRPSAWRCSRPSTAWTTSPRTIPRPSASSRRGGWASGAASTRCRRWWPTS